MADKKVKAIALCRVSSVEQLQNNSLNVQDSMVKEIAERHNLEIIKVWSGSVSSKRGRNIKRKDIKEMLDYCVEHKSVKYLLVSSPDRFMRSEDEAKWAEVEFRKRGVEILFSDSRFNEDNEQSRLWRSMAYHMAEGSNRERIDKAILGNTKAIAAGRYPFQPPIGYMRGAVPGVHEIDPETGPYIQHSLVSIANGSMTIKQAMIWYNENCPPIRDKKHCKVKMDKWVKFIANPYYAGIVEMHKQINARNENGLHEALITKEQHEQILEAISYKKKLHKGPTKGGNKKFPLNKILLCEECLTKGNKFFQFTGYDNTNGKTPKVYSRYYCRGCYKTLSRCEAHEQIKNIINRLDFTEAGRRAIENALNKAWSLEEKGVKFQLELYKRELSNLQEEEQKLLTQILDTKSQKLKEGFTKRYELVEEEIKKKESLIKSTTKSLELGRSDFLKFALEYIDNMGTHFFELPLEEVGVCKNILFPGGFWMGPDKIIYTPGISPLYRERAIKNGASNSENALVVGDEGLEPPTFSV